MPTYDYQCRSCGRTIEVVHRMSEDGPTACETCGGPLRRLLYPAGIIFKGSGFYKTDSRGTSSAVTSSNGTRGSDDGSKAAPAASGDGASTKKESPKPASGEASEKR